MQTSETAKVRDYPGLRKGRGFVINVDGKEYIQAKARAQSARRHRQLESQVQAMGTKLDEIMGLLTQFAENQRV